MIFCPVMMEVVCKWLRQFVQETRKENGHPLPYHMKFTIRF